MSLRRSIAPMRHVHRREKEQCRRKGQFCLTVQSVVAWSELLTSSEKARPEEHASCCDPDKGETARQGSELARFRGKETNTTGDAFLATFDGPARAVRCALAIVLAPRQLGIQAQAGVHNGECELMGDNVGSIAVHTGACIMAKAEPGGVPVSGTV